MEELRDELFTGTISANARAAVGSVGVDALVEVDASGALCQDDNRAQAHSVAGFKDTLTISSPTLNGTAGSISFNVAIDGGFLASFDELPTDPANFTVARWAYRVGNNYSVADAAYADDLTLQTSVAAATTFQPFTYGTPFDLSAELSLDLYTVASRATFSFASATFLHSANLNGIAGVHDSLGNPVNDFTISADSGADYTKPFSSVPEPDNACLPALVGLAVLGFMRRRRAA